MYIRLLYGSVHSTTVLVLVELNAVRMLYSVSVVRIRFACGRGLKHQVGPKGTLHIWVDQERNPCRPGPREAKSVIEMAAL